MPTPPVPSKPGLWVLMAFEKLPGNRLVKDWVLPSFSDDDARLLLGLPPNDPVYADYEVTLPMVPTLRRYVKGRVQIGPDDGADHPGDGVGQEVQETVDALGVGERAVQKQRQDEGEQ